MSMFYGRSMSGGSGGGMLKTVGRAVTRVGVSGNGMQDPFSSSSSTTTTASATPASNSSSRSTSPTLSRRPKSSSPLSLNSSSNPQNNKNPLSGLPFRYSSAEADDCDWVCVDGTEDEGTHGFSIPYFLESVPSQDEVEDAVYALQQVFGPASNVHNYKDKVKWDGDVVDHVTTPGFLRSADGLEIDWKEPSLSPYVPYDSRMVLSNGSDRVSQAFHLLQTEPTVQKMVKSLSSDKAVWEAVLNNEVVREFRDLFSSDEEKVSENSDETPSTDPNTKTNVVMWIFDTAKAKFMEVIEKITKVVHEMFEPAIHKTPKDAESSDPLTEKLKTSFMLSIMVLLVVVVSRANRA
ncbi:uncharacterized protein G2W53_002801 [Senna tora]|uniref:Uncharacterized protein n=1 Tax=Senna tora TaxID=362788 RepID=A0A834X7W9_9FABA|nr:uncharacterized protein G2W53_002801 [Senna tora]